MTSTSQIIRRVTTSDVATLDEILGSTVEGIIPDALALNQGIRVSRIGPGDYLVEIAPDLPCGYTTYEAY
jgi:hypothetical protein